MKARYAGTCHGCSEKYDPGADVEKWLGKWMHRKCKLQSRSALEAGAEVIQLEDGPVKRSAQTVRPRGDFGKKKASVLW